MRRALTFALALAICCNAANVPKRIVSLSPNMTEMLYGMGAFDRLVGVSDYCTYPPAVRKLPSVGGWYNPSLEKLAGLRPELVILDNGQAPFLVDRLKELGLRTVIAPDQSVSEIYTAIAMLGRVTGHESEAAKLTTQVRDGLQRVARRTGSLSKPTVMVMVNRTPGTLRDLTTATPGSFYSELIDIAGGHLAAHPDRHGYSKLSKEELLAINPDVILDFIHGAESSMAGDPMVAWREMPELKAVRTKRVYGVAEDYVPHASQRIVQTAELFARLLHPEAR